MKTARQHKKCYIPDLIVINGEITEFVISFKPAQNICAGPSQIKNFMEFPT